MQKDPHAAQNDSDDEFQDAIDDFQTAGQTQVYQYKPGAQSEVIMIDVDDLEEAATQEDPSRFICTNVDLPPNSFIDSRQDPDPKCPPPLYFSDQILTVPLPVDKETYLKGMVEHESGYMICTDEEAIEKQKGVLGNVAKQLAINLLKGLSISHISLPIKIFEPRSSIQRIADLWSGAPHYLSYASMQQDPVERMKNVVAFAMSSYVLITTQHKPFNPLLGETNQGMFPDGTRYYCEHTSHHPPITNFLLEGPDNSFRVYGYYEFIGSMGKNSLTSGLRGPVTVDFPDGGALKFNVLDWKLGGTIMGERTCELIGSLVVEDAQNLLKTVLSVSTYKAKGFFGGKTSGNKSDYTGVIYKIKQSAFKPTVFGKNQKLPEDLTKLTDVEKKLCELSGNIFKRMEIGGQVYWDIDQHQVTRQIPQTEQNTPGVLIMPSDWRFREDLVWLKYGFMTIAAAWKLRLEVQQRKDRKERQTGAQKLKAKK